MIGEFAAAALVLVVTTDLGLQGAIRNVFFLLRGRQSCSSDMTQIFGERCRMFSISADLGHRVKDTLPRGLRQQGFLFSQLWRLELGAQGARRLGF